MSFDPHAPQQPQSEITLTPVEPEFQVSLEQSAEWPPWSGWDVLLIAVVTIASIVVLSGVALAIAALLSGFRGMPLGDLARDARIIVPAQTVSYALVICLMAMIVKRGYGRRFWRDIHWNFPYSTWHLFLLAGVLLAIFIQLSSALLPIPKQLPIEKFFNTATSAYIMGVFGISAAPLFEELFFRALLYPKVATSVAAASLLALIECFIVVVASRKAGLWVWLLPVLAMASFGGWLLYLWISRGTRVFEETESGRKLGVGVGVAATAFCFALIHQSQLGYAWGPLLLLFAVGLVLTAVRARLNTVAGSFLIHVAYNSTLFFLLWLQTDHFRHMEKAARLLSGRHCA